MAATYIDVIGDAGGPPVFEQRFASVQLDLSLETKQPIYKVPIGKTFFLTQLVLRNASESLNTASVGFGFNDEADNVFASDTQEDLESSDEMKVLAVSSASPIGAEGSVFGALCTVTQTATVFVDLFGYLL